MAKAEVLIVENDERLARELSDILQREGFSCTVAVSPAQVNSLIERNLYDVVIADYTPNREPSGIDILRDVKRKWREVEVILVSDYDDAKFVRNALKVEGAFDFFKKPLVAEEIVRSVEEASRRAQAARERFLLIRKLDEEGDFGGIVYASEPMRKILRIVKQIAPSNITVLLQGESGTGKDLIARAIHNNSPRRHRRMVTLDCAGLSEGVLESELFGHVKGAFTGAISSRKGRFEYADGSTLFLDEIGEMPINMQAKLLRALETKEIIPVGSNEPIKVDVRLISATNRDLQQAVKEKQFREDLYFRIKGVTLRIPPLRERREDIPVLIRHFLQRFAEEHRRPVLGISPEAEKILVNYHWPGNVRELKNTIESMAVLANKAILDVEDIPEEIREQTPKEQSTAIVPLTSLAGKSLQELEKEHIKNTLRLTGGNRERAAHILGIAPRTLYRKLKEYGIS